MNNIEIIAYYLLDISITKRIKSKIKIKIKTKMNRLLIFSIKHIESFYLFNCFMINQIKHTKY